MKENEEKLAEIEGIDDPISEGGLKNDWNRKLVGFIEALDEKDYAVVGVRIADDRIRPKIELTILPSDMVLE